MNKMFKALTLVILLVVVASCTGSPTTPPSSAKAIAAFSFVNPAATGSISESAKTISITVPYGTDVTTLVATFTTTGNSVKVGTVVQASGVTQNNFTNPVIYTVTAADRSTVTYTTTVTIAPSSAKAITAFSFASPAATGTINEGAKTISVTVPYGTDVTALAATFFTTSASVAVGSAIQVSGTTPNNFTNPVAYVVTAADGSTTTYTATVTVALSTQKAITAFSFGNPAATGTINEGGKTISVNVPYGTDVTALIATFTTTGANITVGGIPQISGTTPNNFTNPIAYVVSAADNSASTYTATVTVAQNPAKAITAFSFTSPAATGAINESAKTISVNVPYGTDVTTLVACFITTGASVTVTGIPQVSGTTANDYTNPVIYTVTAADSTTAAYTVTVHVTAATNLPRTGQTGSYAADDDGALQKGVAWPNPRFTVGTGTEIECVTDQLTGLMWVKTPENISRTWQMALDSANSLTICGHSDWRLPNINELKSLVSYGQTINTTWLNTQGFNIQYSNYSNCNPPDSDWVTYWSSTSMLWSPPEQAMIVDLYRGRLNNTSKSSNTYMCAWPVRTAAPGTISLAETGQKKCYDSAGTEIPCTGTGQDGELRQGVGWPNPRFTTNMDTTVRDNLTNLVWAPNGNIMPARDSNWDQDGTVNDGKISWQHALNYIAKLNAENYLGHSDWRLPNINESTSLNHAGFSEETCGGSPCSSDVAWLISQGFSNVPDDFGYWSSTSYAANPESKAWAAGGDSGKATNAYVWPVRSGE